MNKNQGWKLNENEWFRGSKEGKSVINDKREKNKKFGNKWKESAKWLDNNTAHSIESLYQRKGVGREKNGEEKIVLKNVGLSCDELADTDVPVGFGKQRGKNS